VVGLYYERARNVATLILIAVAPVVSAGDKVTWYWKDTNASGFTYPGGHQFDKFMNTTEAPESDTDNTVTLGKGESVWWYAHEAAECDLQFHTGEWSAIYWVKTNSDGGHRINVRLYVVKADGSANLINEKWKMISFHDSPKKKTCSIPTNGPLDLNQGDRLAVEIQWSSNADADDTLTVYYNSTSYDSRLVSPPKSPPYPVPEPSILTLISVGLILFICISGFKRLNDRE
jgi:hypothetical protein